MGTPNDISTTTNKIGEWDIGALSAEAAKHGQLNKIKWLATKKLLNSGLAADYAACYGHIHILKWLNNNLKINPSHYGRTLAIINHRTEICNWLEENGAQLPKFSKL
jgi:hypothetical protein